MPTVAWYQQAKVMYSSLNFITFNVEVEPQVGIPCSGTTGGAEKRTGCFRGDRD